MRKLSYLPIFVVALAFFLAGCAYNTSLVSTSYSALQASEVTYDTAMKAVADLYDRGEIDADEKSEIIAVATTYSKAHNAAVEALASYQESGSMSDQDRLAKQTRAASIALGQLMSIIKPYIGEETNND